MLKDDSVFSFIIVLIIYFVSKNTVSLPIKPLMISTMNTKSGTNGNLPYCTKRNIQGRRYRGLGACAPHIFSVSPGCSPPKIMQKLYDITCVLLLCAPLTSCLYILEI